MSNFFLISILIIGLMLAPCFLASSKINDQSKSEGRSEEREDLLAREQWLYSQRAFPFRAIPPGARERALQFVREKMRLSQNRKLAPNITGNSWLPFGPDSIPNGFVFPNNTGSVSGRVSTLAIDRN